jgi:hypothetical protein
VSTLAPPRPPTRPTGTPRPVAAPPRRRRRRVLLLGALLLGLVVLAPVALLAGAGNPPCATPTGTSSTPTATPTAGQFAAPLQMQVGHWYRVGATQYGGPADPASGVYGSSGAYLPGEPDSFAELSLLDHNPANTGGALTFDDADALGDLPYGTAVRVANGRRSLVLFKRDIGYGQGPGQSIPYRLDVWWQAAAQLGVTKTAVQIELMPGSGSGALLGQTPESASGPATAAGTGGGCGAGGGGGPLPITTGPVAQINPSTGIAAAPAGAPRAVKLAIAAANQLIDRPYVWGGGHADLNQLAAGYDCSGSVEYVLHQAGLYAPASGPSSTAFEHHYPPGPGRWITVYANQAHMFIAIAGVVLDTAWYAPVAPTTPASGPRWQPGSTVQAQLAGNAAAGNPAFSVTHPPGL